MKTDTSVNIVLPLFSFTSISSHRWVLQKRKYQTAVVQTAGSASLDTSLCNKWNSFPKASAHKIWPVCLRWIEKIHLFILEITCCICMCKGCLCITAAFNYREWLIVIIENSQNVFPYSASLLCWAKFRTGNEHVTWCTTGGHYQVCLPGSGRIVPMTLSHFCKVVSNW